MFCNFQDTVFFFTFLGFIPKYFIFLMLLVFLFFWLLCKACGILIPDQGSNPCPPTVEAQSPNHWTAREVPVFLYLISDYSLVVYRSTINFCILILCIATLLNSLINCCRFLCRFHQIFYRDN